jgi:hypothetical protein
VLPTSVGFGISTLPPGLFLGADGNQASWLQKASAKQGGDALHLAKTRTNTSHIDSIAEVKAFLLAQCYPSLSIKSIQDDPNC